MSGPWKSLVKPEPMDVVSPEGVVKSRVPGYFSGTQIIFDNMSVDVSAGDEIRRALPNGKEEAFFVEDPTCYTSGPFGPHYQVKISRRGQFPAHTGGNYTVSVSGTNSRVNIGSVDRSSNVVINEGVFDQMREAMSAQIADAGERARLEELITKMQTEQRKPGFAKSYQAFVGGVADHLTIFLPFLPALTGLMN